MSHIEAGHCPDIGSHFTDFTVIEIFSVISRTGCLELAAFTALIFTFDNRTDCSFASRYGIIPLYFFRRSVHVFNCLDLVANNKLVGENDRVARQCCL